MTICNTVLHMTNRKVDDEVQDLTREEAATRLRVSVSTIDRYLKDGTLPKAKLGKRLVRINSSDVDALRLTPATPSAPSSATPADGGATRVSEGAA